MLCGSDFQVALLNWYKMTPMKSRREATRSSSDQRREAVQPADPSRSLGYQIRYAYRAFVKALADELATHSVTTTQWAALRVLWQDEGLSQVELAQRMMVEKASLTTVLEAMESTGMITRTRNAEDKRKINIFLTATGRRLKDKLLPSGGRINTRATRGLTTAEVKQLQVLLAKVMTNLKP